MMKGVGRILEIWRYPVSSVGGEYVPYAELNARGLVGDRQYALIDAKSGMSAAPEKEKKWRPALHLQAMHFDNSMPIMKFPNGESYEIADRLLNSCLSDFFGFATAVGVYEFNGKNSEFPLTRHRHQHSPLHLVTTASLKHLTSLGQVDALDSRRFRPTCLIEANESGRFVENEWIGKHLRLGAVDLTANDPTKRCGITFLPQPGLDEDPEILRSILRHNKRHLGLYCLINAAGKIQVGDELLIDE